VQDPSTRQHHAIHYACSFGSLEVLGFILSVDPNEACHSELIYLATRGRHAAALRMIFLCGARYVPSDQLEHPVMIAVLNNDNACLEVLLKHCPLPTNGDPLLLAVSASNVEGVRLPLGAGHSADPVGRRHSGGHAFWGTQRS
jgi:hypothetical protein